MRLCVECVARHGKLVLLGSCLALLIGMINILPVYAVDSQVSVDVDGSTAPDLQLDGSTSIVSSMPIILTGRVGNLTQIQVYVDGIYTETVPLTPSDTSFSYRLWISEGVRVVKFVGISAYTSTNVEQEVTVTYRVPPVDAQPGATNQDALNSSSSSRNNGIIIGGNVDQPVPSPARPGPGIQTPTWIVRLLVPLDVINPARVEETPRTLWRIMLFTLGLPLLLFASSVLHISRSIHVARFGPAKRVIPLFFRKTPLRWLRLAGAVLLILAFLWV